MKVTQFEGTAEEFKIVANLFSNKSNEEESITNENGLALEDGKVVEPKEAIRKVITRRPVSKGQKAVYNELANNELSPDELAQKIGRTPEQLRGVLGALGKRISNTKEIKQADLPENVTAILRYRSTDEGWFISLTPDAKEVLKEEGIIK